jgi:hypothetical protein
LPVALGDDLVADRGIQRAVHVVQQQRPGIAVTQSADGQLREAGENVVADARARRAHQHDLLGEEAAGDEPEDLRGGTVEPLGVVDDAGQGLLLGDLGEQREGGQPDQEPVGGRADAPAEYRGEGVALGDGQPVEVVQHGRTQLVEAGVGQFHLRLHAHGPGDLPAVDPVGQVVQQGAFAYARLAAEDDDSARTGERVGQESVERRTLAVASEELRGLAAILTRRRPPCTVRRPLLAGISRAYICGRRRGTPQIRGASQGVSRVRCGHGSARVTS